MDVFQLLDVVRKDPGAYLGDRKSLRMLWAFLMGYEVGITTCGKPAIFSDFHPFNKWVAKELGFAEPTSGWRNMVAARSDSDEKAFDRFFELLDRYKRETNQPRQP